MNNNTCQECLVKASDNTKLSVCSACRVVFYCSKECQQINWKYHKRYCKIYKRMLFRSDDPTKRIQKATQSYGIASVNCWLERIAIEAGYIQFRDLSLEKREEIEHLLYLRLRENLFLILDACHRYHGQDPGTVDHSRSNLYGYSNPFLSQSNSSRIRPEEILPSSGKMPETTFILIIKRLFDIDLNQNQFTLDEIQRYIIDEVKEEEDDKFHRLPIAYPTVEYTMQKIPTYFDRPGIVYVQSFFHLQILLLFKGEPCIFLDNILLNAILESKEI